MKFEWVCIAVFVALFINQILDRRMLLRTKRRVDALEKAANPGMGYKRYREMYSDREPKA